MLSWYHEPVERTGVNARVGFDGASLLARLEPLPEPLHVLRHLASGLATDDEGDEEPADPVPGEAQLDRHPRPRGVSQRLHRDGDDGPDRPIDAAVVQAAGRVVLGDGGGHLALAAADAPNRRALGTDVRRRAVHVTAEAPGLPLGHRARVDD